MYYCRALHFISTPRRTRPDRASLHLCLIETLHRQASALLELVQIGLLFICARLGRFITGSTPRTRPDRVSLHLSKLMSRMHPNI
jgi:hypothetical protein